MSIITPDTFPAGVTVTNVAYLGYKWLVDPETGESLAAQVMLPPYAIVYRPQHRDCNGEFDYRADEYIILKISRYTDEPVDSGVAPYQNSFYKVGVRYFDSSIDLESHDQCCPGMHFWATEKPVALAMLNETCRNGDLHATQKWIDRGADLNYGLNRACYYGNRAVIDMMIDRGATNWDFGIYGASEMGRLDIVKYMIARGATPSSGLLFIACINGHHDIAKLIIDEYKKQDLNHNLLMDDINTLLRVACHHGNHKIAELMIASGATDLNMCLGAACMGGHISLVKLMIQHGATDLEGGLNMTDPSQTEIIESLTMLIRLAKMAPITGGHSTRK